MSEVRLTRRYRFSAAHRLHSELLTEAENQQAFGKCNNPYGHGHDYFLEVTVRGPVDGETGLALPVRRLDELVQSEILASFHLRNLNADVPEFATLVPTSENVVVVARKRLEAAWERVFPEGPALAAVRIRETARNVFESRVAAPGAQAEAAVGAGKTAVRVES